MNSKLIKDLKDLKLQKSCMRALTKLILAMISWMQHKSAGNKNKKRHDYIRKLTRSTENKSEMAIDGSKEDI